MKKKHRINNVRDMWKFSEKEGIFTNLRYTSKPKERLFSPNVVQANGMVSDPKEFAHIMVRNLKQYQSMLIAFKMTILKSRFFNDYEKFLPYIESYSVEILDIINKLIPPQGVAFFDLGKTINNMLTIINSSKASQGQNSLDRKIDNVNGEIIKVLENLKNGKKYAHTFLNDYNRIVCSSSFRRLQDKAQVFPLETYDYARTRLTHTIEVSGTAKMLANQTGSQVSEELKKYKKERMSEQSATFLIEKALVNAAQLHDMGNPPFGHYGEDAIKKFFRENWRNFEVVNFNGKQGILHYVRRSKCKREKLEDILRQDIDNYRQIKNDFFFFDGNAQALRVATKLQWHKHKTPLELSAAILGAIIKYPCNSIEGASKEKMGYFFSEEDVIESLRIFGTYKDHKRNPLALLLEAADDISYITADFDDAIKKGVVTYENFKNEAQIYKNSGNPDRNVVRFLDKFDIYYARSIQDEVPEAFSYTIKRMLNKLKSELIAEAAEVYGQYFDNIKEGITYPQRKDGTDICLDKGEYELLKCVPSKSIIEWIQKNIFIKYMYVNKEILNEELKGEVIIKTLLQEFTNAVLSLDFEKDANGKRKMAHRKECGKKFFREEKIFELISKNFADVFFWEYDKAKNEAEKNYYKLRLVVDYVSGMTDSYALECYKVLKGIL